MQKSTIILECIVFLLVGANDALASHDKALVGMAY